MELKRVVVTGLGSITPLGNNVTDTWNAAINGVSGAGPITHFDASEFKTQFACEVKNFDPLNYFDNIKDARKLDLFAQYAIAAVKEAMEDSGIDVEKINRERAGVIYAAGIGGLGTFEQEVTNYALHPERGPRYSPFFIPKMIADIAAGQISMIYGFHGPNFGTVSACASSNHSLIDAYNYIRLGKADVIISGGAEAAIYAAGVGGFNSMHALSTRNDSPQTASRPFSGSRDGFVMGEGGSCLILEEMEHALARGARIYAEIAGGGLASVASPIGLISSIIPALFTNKSNLPNSFTAKSIIFSLSSNLLTSPWNAITLPASFANDATNSSKRSFLLATAITFAPSLTYLSTIALPIPDDAPVTTIDLPCNFI